MDKQRFLDSIKDLPGATHRYKEEWGADLLEVGGKMYAMVGQDKPGEDILTVKMDPALGEAMRATHDYILPGYYMNKVHWSSIYYLRGVDEELVMQLLRGSYDIVLASLPKKAQAAIRGE